MSRLYLDAARVVASALERRRSVKNLVYALPKSSLSQKRQLVFLCSHTIANRAALEAALSKSGALEALNDVRESLLLVLAFEMLLGSGVRGGGQLKRRLKAFEGEMRAHLPSISAGNRPEHVFEGRPRFLRVNTLLTCDAEVLQELQVLNKAEWRVDRDPHIPHLVLIRPISDDDKRFRLALRRLATGDLVNSGRAVLQDKASCFSAQALLQDGWGFDGAADVIDACAAPGNKTTHVAALLREWWAALDESAAEAFAAAPRVLAYDKDPERAKVLRQRLEQLCGGAGDSRGSKRQQKRETVAEALEGDFLALDPSDTCFSKVRGILLDPSCSGSGMVRHDSEGDTRRMDKKRIRALSAFQAKALAHALSFPQVRRVVYSTCSLHAEENEDVVAGVLSTRRDAWELVKVLRTWARRGGATSKACPSNLSDMETQCLVRASAEDGTHGFFVACFQRIGESPTNAGPVSDIPCVHEEQDGVGDGQSKEVHRDDSGLTLDGLPNERSNAEDGTGSKVVDHSSAKRGCQKRKSRSTEARRARKRRKRNTTKTRDHQPSSE